MASNKSKSKYAALRGKYPELPPDDAKAQEMVDKIKSKLRADGKVNTPMDVIWLYIIYREKKEEKEIELSNIQKELTALEQLIQDSQKNQEEGWGLYGATEDGFKLPDGSLISVEHDPTAKVVDKEANRLWCIEQGLVHSMFLHHGVLNSMTKELIQKGKPEPPGVEVYMRKKVKYTAK